MNELEKKCADIIKSELRVSEEVEHINDNYSPEEVDEAMVNVVNVVVGNVDDPVREAKVYKLTLQLGQALVSRNLVAFARKSLEEWQETYHGE